MVQLIQDLHFDINRADANGVTPLHYAVASRYSRYPVNSDKTQLKPGRKT